ITERNADVLAPHQQLEPRIMLTAPILGVHLAQRSGAVSYQHRIMRSGADPLFARVPPYRASAHRLRQQPIRPFADRMIVNRQAGSGPVDRVASSAAHVDACGDLAGRTAKAESVAKYQMQTTMS